MTDNEIIKALPKVLYGGHGCSKCKYDNGRGDDRCGLKGCRIARNALDLINRQKAEIERLEKANESFSDMGKLYSEIKSEAIKEFADEFKKKAGSIVTRCRGYEIYETKQYQISAINFDNLVKEMTE